MVNNLKFKKNILVSIIGASCLAGYNVSAYAEEAIEKKEEAIEKIIVTSRMRVETLQDVPIAITAFNEEAIEDAGISRASDFLALTPNVTFASSESSGVNFMTIRGLTQVRNGESPVAVVVDGVLMTDPAQFDQELFDVQRIEVLKGPQGALYGRNAIGGAINISTKEPSENFEGKIKAGLGNGNRKKIQAGVSGGINDDLFFRLAGSYVEHDGYIENIFLNEKVDFYEDTSLRGRLTWIATDDLSVDFRASHTKTEGGALNFVLNADYNVFDFVGDADDTSIPITANRLGEDERDITSLSLKLDYDLDFATLTAITSKDTLENFYTGSAFPYECLPACTLSAETAPTSQAYVDAFGSPLPSEPGSFIPVQIAKVFTEVDTFSQELRLTSTADGDLRWIAGLYYLQTDRYRAIPTDADIGQEISPDLFNENTLFGFADDNDNTAYAVFTQFNYDLNHQIELSFALRYDSDKREQTDVAPAKLSSTTGSTRSETFSELQPNLTVRYQPSDEMTIFATLSKGFRSGGFNQNGVGKAAADAGINGIFDEYEKEVSANIELGFKASFLDQDLKVNGGVFRTDVNNQHFFQFLGAINAQLLNNIDEVLLQGVELDVQYKVMDGLQVYAAYGITDSEIKSYTVAPSDIGNWAPYVPKSTFNAGIQYSFSISSNVETTFRVDYERRGKQYWDTANTTARSALNLVNLHFGIRAIDDDWSLIAWSKNATDEEYNAEFVAGGFASIAPPNTYGIDFTKRF